MEPSSALKGGGSEETIVISAAFDGDGAVWNVSWDVQQFNLDVCNFNSCSIRHHATPWMKGRVVNRWTSAFLILASLIQR